MNLTTPLEEMWDKELAAINDPPVEGLWRGFLAKRVGHGLPICHMTDEGFGHARAGHRAGRAFCLLAA